MENTISFSRITINPAQMNGEPCIRNLRIPVKTIAGLLTNRMSRIEILTAYPDLEAGDIEEVLLFIAEPGNL